LFLNKGNDYVPGLLCYYLTFVAVYPEFTEGHSCTVSNTIEQENKVAKKKFLCGAAPLREIKGSMKF